MPSPSSLNSIKQYFDESKENILVIWDHPNDVFGDIKYKIKLEQEEEMLTITQLPYKCKLSKTLTPVELRIATMSVIGEKEFEGHLSDVICIGI